ncbi:MAG: monooxygenase [Myxococcales bacterium SG8_38]|nr:MAG: monooxygenase [Myxococcales bacterium SG8_38]
MQIGVHLANLSWPGGPTRIAPTLAAIARSAEQVGCEHVSVMDHWFQMDQMFPVDNDMLEAYTMLGFLAAHTERVQLHVLVTGVTYRHPGLLAKIVATLDVLSGGRAGLGIGAAWYEREHAGLGVPFPSVGERLERLEETLEICLQMWSDDNGPYEGRYYHLAETLCVPQPPTRPRPPILIGGGGEKKLLRLVARYADASNLIATDFDQVAHKLEVLRRHCDDLGRNPDEIAKTILYVGDALAKRDSDQFLREMSRYATLGISTVIVMPLDDDPIAFVERLGTEVIPALSAL